MGKLKNSILKSATSVTLSIALLTISANEMFASNIIDSNIMNSNIIDSAEPNSSEASDTPAVTIAPPEIIRVENASNGISLIWKRKKDVAGYNIYRGKNKIKTLKGYKQNNFIDTDACKSSKKYVYYITAFKKIDGQIVESDKSEAITHYFVKPTNITDASFDSGTCSLKWNNVNNVKGYEISYSPKISFKKQQTQISFKDSCKIKDLSGKSDYYFRIRTYIKVDNTCYYSAWTTSCKIISWNSKWKFAKNSVIHSDSAILYYSSADNPRHKTVCVNAGHGTNGGESKKTLCHPDGSPKVTGGTAAKGSTKTMSVSSGTILLDGTQEKVANLNIALNLKDKLLAAGYNVLMIRENNNVQLDNIARTVIANNNADYHIAIHYDSSESDKGAFFTGVPNISSYRRMEPVASNWKKHEALGTALVKGLKKSGVKIYSNGRIEVDLTQTSYSTIASIDLEVGDRKSDHSQKTIDKITDGILAGLNALN